jgi:hypothetical protein
MVFLPGLEDRPLAHRPCLLGDARGVGHAPQTPERFEFQLARGDSLVDLLRWWKGNRLHGEDD